MISSSINAVTQSGLLGCTQDFVELSLALMLRVSKEAANGVPDHLVQMQQIDVTSETPSR